MPWQKFLRDLLILWATIDPISTVVIFAGLTSRLNANKKARVAARAILYSGVVLVGAAVLGQFILLGMGISIVSFQLAGGIVLFLFALQMIFGNLHSSNSPETEGDIAVYPLAIPSIATPGAILAIIVLTDNHLHPVPTQAGTILIAIAILAITYLLMRQAHRILDRLGRPGAELIVRVMGMILAALSVELIVDALRSSNFF
ncbi:MAG: MarC family protein [Anaerolineales bacterium]